MKVHNALRRREFVSSPEIPGSKEANGLRRLPLERFHQTTHIRLRLHLLDTQLIDLIRLFSHRRQVVPRHVTAVVVVVFSKLHQKMIEVLLAEDDEFIEAFEFYRLDESLTASVEIGTGLG